MSEYFAPPILVSLLILYILFIWILTVGVRDYRHSLREAKRLKIFEIKEGKVNTLAALLRELELPFAFEIAISHIGKDRKYYLIVPESRTDEVKSKFSDAMAAKDYNIYHPGGVNRGVYLKSDKERPILDFRSLDFSKVNEIGESAVLQIVASGLSGGRRQVNLRVFISAPTAYQAEEILMNLRAGFTDFRLAEAKGADFLRRLNNRIFDEKEALIWG